MQELNVAKLATSLCVAQAAHHVQCHIIPPERHGVADMETAIHHQGQRQQRFHEFPRSAFCFRKGLYRGGVILVAAMAAPSSKRISGFFAKGLRCYRCCCWRWCFCLCLWLFWFLVDVYLSCYCLSDLNSPCHMDTSTGSCNRGWEDPKLPHALQQAPGSAFDSPYFLGGFGYGLAPDKIRQATTVYHVY